MPGEEFAEGGGPAAIRDLETPRHLRIGKTRTPQDIDGRLKGVFSKFIIILFPSEK